MRPSEAGGYITGETIVVDGGQWLYTSPMAPRDVIRELSRGVGLCEFFGGLPHVISGFRIGKKACDFSG